jgi:Leucine-rich repeat (LRR) protein
MILIVKPETIYLLNNIPNDITLLDCSGCKLKHLPTLFHLDKLKILCCYNNQLTELPVLPSNLEILYCNNNKLKHLNCLLFATNIKQIFCHRNRIQDIPDFRLLPKLELFNGAINQIDKRIVDIMTLNISFKQKVMLLELNNLFDKPLPYKLLYRLYWSIPDTHLGDIFMLFYSCIKTKKTIIL